MVVFSHKNTLGFIINSLKPFSISIAMILLSSIALAISISFKPYLLKIILDNLSSLQKTDSLFHSIATPTISYIMVFIGHKSLARLSAYLFNIRTIPNLRKHIAIITFNTLLKKDYSYYQDNFAGSLANKINDLTNYIPEFIQIVADKSVARILSLLLTIYFLGKVDSIFAISMIVWSLLFISFSASFSKRITSHEVRWASVVSSITGKMVDIFSNIMSVKLFNKINFEQSSFSNSYSDSVKAERDVQWNYTIIFTFYDISFIIMQIINLFFLIKELEKGLITIGSFSFVMSINIAIYNFIWELALQFSQCSKAWGRINDAIKTIGSDDEIRDCEHFCNIDKGIIVFENVNFYYENSNLIFNNLSVKINGGEKVGLVGHSGAGKSTFINLIIKFYNINSGRILLDSNNINDINQYSLRENITVMPQDLPLFHRTLMDNIRYGKIDASYDEVINAAKKARAHEFIMKLPKKYDSLVGERGIKLSGGQRQRISIARAILRNTKILIIDEATSQLDSITENFIQESLLELMKNKTTIVIAHRLSTLLKMDRILVFDKGQIVGDGKHIELLNQNNIYKDLWEKQIKSFSSDFF